MLGHFGFSYIGLIFFLMLIIPNILFSKCVPSSFSSEGENKVLLVFERIGEVLSITFLLIFEDYNISALSAWSLWFIASFFLMLFYDLWWIKYLRSKREIKDFYSSFLFIPLAGATLPPLSLLLLGIYGKVLPLMLSSIILSIGHIGIHLRHYRAFKS